MWNIIGGFVVSSVAEVFVKELVKEIKKPRKPQPQKEAREKAAESPIKHSEGQVMILDWVPRKPAAKKRPRAKRKAGTS